MTRRAGIRRWVRWACLAATVILPVVWGASLFWYVWVELDPSGTSFGLGEGSLFWSRRSNSVGYSGWNVAYRRRGQDKGIGIRWLPEEIKMSSGLAGSVPLWIPWLLPAGLTAWRFRADRLNSPHACPKCDYDRRGLVGDAPCPECGAKVSRFPSPAHLPTCSPAHLLTPPPPAGTLPPTWPLRPSPPASPPSSPAAAARS